MEELGLELTHCIFLLKEVAIKVMAGSLGLAVIGPIILAFSLAFREAKILSLKSKKRR